MPTIHLEGQVAPEELLAAVDQLEALEAQRIERLSRLAHLRGVSLAALMDELGIQPPAHG